MENHTHSHARPQRDMSHIKGWGVDLDHKNRPAYPMEHTPPRLDNRPTHEPEQQHSDVTVFHSTERPSLTPVFGTTVPPKGLSGLIRSAAFKLSENDIRHWLMLLMADRVDMVEGLGADLLQGKVPNVFAEMGIKAEWEHNPAGLVKKAAIASAVVGLGYYLFKRRRDR